MSVPTLYDYHRSSAGYRVRTALNPKCVVHVRVAVSLLAGEHRAPGDLVRNPHGLVPALDIGDGTMSTRSPAILDWLDAAYPRPRLFPADPPARAAALPAFAAAHPDHVAGKAAPAA